VDLHPDGAPGQARPLRFRLNQSYCDAVRRTGGVPVILAPDPDCIPEYLSMLDGVILTGGDDIDPRPWGGTLHPKSELMHPVRQAFDFALLDALAARPQTPVLGICLGMQEMGVHRGCRLIQHLPDEFPRGGEHADDRVHRVDGEFGRGPVTSAHHQGLGDGGPFEVLARSEDGVIETIRDPRRSFYLGVQWHPERTADPLLGDGVIRRLVDAARR